ncbi:MAG: OmpA family protein [Bacteroidales bacterium]|nr:OmpA family protein [Bacteroidales bacterium]
MKLKYVILLILLLVIFVAHNQNIRKIKKEAQQYFDNEEYNKALPLFLKLDTLIPNDFEIKYHIGACYLNSEFNKTEGIPYLKFAIEKGAKHIPPVVYVNIAELYHLNRDYDEALKYLNIYIKNYSTDITYITKAKKLIEYCENAKKIESSARNVEDFVTLPDYINSAQDEIEPFISADGNILVFTRQFYKIISGIEFRDIKKFYVAKKENNKWGIPEEIIIPQAKNNKDIKIAGISLDGRYIYFALYDGKQYDIYYSKLTNNKCLEFIKLPEIINSQYNEISISVSRDGRSYYFSSDRPGGFGGYDIYRASLDDNNKWSIIENLGSNINTQYNEISPFIHPNNRTLYFSSEGHFNIGGYDIFSIDLLSKGLPENIGMPFNTPGNDMYYITTADGNLAYFTQYNNTKRNDIIEATLHKSIPLTLIKGKIITNNKKINAKIHVIDKATNKPLKYVYDPDEETGKYFIILPPNKAYILIVEEKGFLPQAIEIFVPNQTYFYELYQDITLKSITINENEKPIGQEIIVKNKFYDIYNSPFIDSIQQKALMQKSDSIIKLIESIILSEGSHETKKIDELIYLKTPKEKERTYAYNKLLDIIESSIEKEDSLTLRLLDANTIYDYTYEDKYYYESEKNNLFTIIVGNDTIITLPPIVTKSSIQIITPEIKEIADIEILPSDEKTSLKNTAPEKRRYIYISYVFYKSGSSSIDKKYYSTLKNILNVLKSDNNIGVEINGYTDLKGSDELNLKLSIERAENIAKFFINENIDPDRIIISGKGKDTNTKIDFSLMRRSEIKLFEAK